MNKNIIYGGIVLSLVVGLIGIFIATRPITIVKTVTGEPQAQRFGGTTGLDSLALKGNLTVDGTAAVTGITTLTGELDIGAASTTGNIKTYSLSVGNGTTILGHLYTTATVNVNNLTAGSATSIGATLTGVAAGDVVRVDPTGPWGTTSSSVMVLGTATAANTVTLTWVNTSGTAVDLSSAVYNISAWKH
jgi:hypothetical protein